MNGEILNYLEARGAELVRFIDISGLPTAAAAGFPRAVVFAKEFRGSPSVIEHLVEGWSDELAAWLCERGYRAHAQSQRSNEASGRVETGFARLGEDIGVSLVPQKTLACLAGIGYIGKNNLLVSQRYGCAICMCSVLTDAPLESGAYAPVADQCGDCDACVQVCPWGALHGGHWTKDGGREALLDVSQCSCCLKCMMECPRTQEYLRGKAEEPCPAT